MVTGDNVRTAISVARECGLVSHSASVYIPTFLPGTGNTEEARLEWSSVDDDRHKLDDFTLKPIANQSEGLALEVVDGDMADYQLALTGDVFKWMLEYAEVETMERVSFCRLLELRLMINIDAGQRRNLRTHVARRESRACGASAILGLHGRLLWRWSE